MKRRKIIVLGVIITLVVAITSITILKMKTKVDENPEILKSRSYVQVQAGDEKINGTDFVQFDAYYLRDLDGDGYAEKLRGTCRQVGTQDTLYIDLNVLTNGTLKDAKININGDNFYFSTALVKDNVISKDYISSNTKEIVLNNVPSGNQKLIFGMVQSGDYSKDSTIASAIGNDVNKYSSTNNTITLTGTHVADDGSETQISKTVTLTNDWHGTTKTEFYMPSWYKNQECDVDTSIDKENNKFNVYFKLNVKELDKQLILYKNHVEGQLPLINGYAPTNVTVSNQNTSVLYDKNTRVFTLETYSTINESGIVTNTISRDIYYEINVEYPLEAYTKLGEDTVAINVPISSYYEGYNNSSKEFKNPYKSNIAQDLVSIVCRRPQGNVAIVDVSLGKYVKDPDRYVISKELPLNTYNNVETEENSLDRYLVRWYAYTGTGANNVPLCLKETPENYSDQFVDVDNNYISMDRYVSNVGIYFSYPESMLGDNGYINVYNDETNELLHKFTKDDWNMYNESKPYMYENKVKHIRVETSNVSKSQSMYVYNVKEIDDALLTAELDKETYNKIDKIYSNLTGYLKINGSNNKINSDTNFASYEASNSVANLNMDPESISNQETKKNAKINITTEVEEFNTKKWQNGEFLIKYPQEIIAVNINNVTSEDKAITITGVDTYEENGNIYTKIYTSNSVEKALDIVIDADITADPRKATATRNLELYYYNPACHNYNSNTKDIYDVNCNDNKDELVGYTAKAINIIAPSNLLTSQIATDYDNNNSLAIAPQDAIINKNDGSRTAKININVINNYSNTISDIKIVGKIPFKGNTYQLNGADLGSTFNTAMTSNGITIPDELKEYATVYYSYNEKVTDDINSKKNGWTKTPQDFTKVKSYLIYLGDYVLPINETKTFGYTIQTPAGLNYNDISYSNYAIYYCLDTDQGKLKTQTEPNKLGFLIAEKYDLEITKYETNSNKVVQGVVFSAQEVGKDETKTSATYSNGIATLKNLYVEREYIVKEIRTNDNYVLNDTENRIIGHIVNGEFQIEVLDGNFKTGPQVEKNENANSKVKFSLENEIRYNFELNKTLQGTNEAIRGILFELKNNKTGTTKVYTTNKDGKLKLNLLEPNVQYTLTETQSNGHYLKDPVTFIMVRDSNKNLKFNVLSGELNTAPVMDMTGEIPKVVAGLSNEKIPTYSLRITKKETGTDSVIKGAQFKLIGANKEDNILYTTDENGTVQINNIYQFVEGKNITGEYTLQEVYPTEGYILNETPIVFKAQKDASGNLKLQIISGTIRENIEDIQVDNTDQDNPIINITIDNDPIFTLTKIDSKTKEPLEGVEFEITDNNGNKAIDVNGNAIDKLLTDSNGKIRLNLKEGLYKIIETNAIDGYIKSDKVTEFGIGASKKAKYKGVIEWENAEKTYAYEALTTIPGEIIAIGGENIVRYGLNGNVIADNVSESQAPKAIKATKDDAVILCNGFNVFKADYNGKTIKQFPDAGTTLNKALEIDDYGITVGSWMGNRFARFDLDGNLLWSGETKENVGGFYSSITPVEGGIVVALSSGNIAKYDYDGNLIWNQTDPEIKSWYRGVTNIDNKSTISVSSDGFVVRADENGNIEWINKEKTYSYYGVALAEGGVVAVATGGQVVKYSFDGEIMWENTEKTYSYRAVESTEGGVIAVSYSGQVVKYKDELIEPEIPAAQNITLENDRETHKITTEVNGVGGTISGQNDNPYETVLHGEDSNKNIIATPNNGYKVVEITVNGEKVSYIANDNGTVELDKFTNVTSDKHIVVKFSDTASDIIEHHYEKGTTIRVAEDKVQYGNIGDRYVTSPKINIQNFSLSKLDNGEYEIPSNASGVFTKDTQVVTYYYERKPFELIVHHYIDGTEDKVADDEISNGEEGDSYTTNPVTYPELDDRYELVESKLPENANGTFTDSVTEVTYYYKTKDFKITTEVEGIGGIISGQNENPYETVKYNEDSIKDITIKPNNGYEIESIKINNVEQELPEDKRVEYTLNKFINMIEDKHIVVKFRATEVEICFTKEWHDDNNSAGKRPDSVKFEIYDGSNKLGEKVLTKEDGYEPMSVEDNYNGMWSSSINIPLINEKGELIDLESLTFIEKEVNTNDLEFYTTSIRIGAYDLETLWVYITNTFTVPETTKDLTVTKKWEDNTNINSKRPNQIKLQVKNGDTVVQEQAIDVTSENTQTYTFTGLQEYDKSGNEIEYTIDEDEVNENDLKFYSKSIDNENYIITNTFTVPEDKITLDVTKKWEDNLNENNTRPSQIKLQVKNGDTVVQEKAVDVTEENEKVYSFTDLAKYGENGQEIKYTVDELEVNESDLVGYTKNIEENVITNTIKKYNITTEVNGIGGTISGQEDNPYEIVNHGGSSKKDIVITPNIGYEISKITINNVEQELPEDKKVEYTLDKFINMVEDKHIIVEFKKIEYKITTEVEGIGGTISGQEDNPYEIVFHGENSIKDIVVTPSKGYKITSIKVNEEVIEFTSLEDGTYILDKFINMIEDKHIVVTFESKETSIVVKHQTEEGKDLVNPETIEGKVGDEYKTNAKEFDEYELKIMPDNASGEMQEEQIEVIYIYNLVKGKVTITKVDKKDNTKLLSGATFKIEKLDDSGNIDTTYTAQEKTTGEDGKIEFIELLIGKYRITETKAPEGYELSEKSTEIEISKLQKEVNIVANNRLKLELPATGGLGAIIFTIIGIGSIIIAKSLKNKKSSVD